jgi:DNA-dependent RNA polymerase auxiliary subunit epsilon
MTDLEIIEGQHKVIVQQAKHIKKLTRRLLEKKKYELEFLKMAGASTEYRQNIDAKDRKALEE